MSLRSILRGSHEQAGPPDGVLHDRLLPDQARASYAAHHEMSILVEIGRRCYSCIRMCSRLAFAPFQDVRCSLTANDKQRVISD